MKGEVAVAPDTPSPVDWRFGGVAAQPHTIGYMAMPVLSEEAKAFAKEIPDLETPLFPSVPQYREILERWSELPESQAKIERNREVYEELKRMYQLIDQHNHRNHDPRLIIGVMDENGAFQLDDLTPGNWTLEITLNFPKIPSQDWDFADVWQAKRDIIVPEFHGDKRGEELRIWPFFLGFDRSDRRGPER